MKREILIIIAAVLIFTPLTNNGAQANGAPQMPYIFEMNCFGCHKEPEQTGPIGIFDMQTKTGNPLHEQRRLPHRLDL